MEGPDIVVGTPSVLLGHIQAKVLHPQQEYMDS